MEITTPSSGAVQPPREMHTRQVAAQKSGLTTRGLDDMIARGLGPRVTRFGRRVLIRDDHLREWWDSLAEQQEADVDEQRAAAKAGRPPSGIGGAAT